MRTVVENGPDAVRWLIEQGVAFTRENDQQNYHLTQKGGIVIGDSSHRRRYRKEVTGTLVEQVIARTTLIFSNNIVRST